LVWSPATRKIDQIRRFSSTPQAPVSVTTLCILALIVREPKNMDNPLNHAYALSSIFTRYKRIHDKVFNFSIASPIRVSGRSSLEPLRAYEQELSSLRKELGAIQEQLSVLEKQKARQKTTEGEVLDVVTEYTNALSETIDQLQYIFRNLRLEYAGDEALLGYRENEYREDCAAYDDSIQEYRRLGLKLKAAFENR
jgi:hypothetical protein